MSVLLYLRGNCVFPPPLYQGSPLSLPLTFTCPHHFREAWVNTSRRYCLGGISDYKNPSPYDCWIFFTQLSPIFNKCLLHLMINFRYSNFIQKKLSTNKWRKKILSKSFIQKMFYPEITWLILNAFVSTVDMTYPKWL